MRGEEESLDMRERERQRQRQRDRERVRDTERDREIVLNRQSDGYKETKKKIQR